MMMTKGHELWHCDTPGTVLAHTQGSVKEIPPMFDILNPPTVVLDVSDSQLHQDYTIDSEKISLLSESQPLAFGLKSYLFCILQKSKFN
jgi:hypothetical protein